eukprot:g294.t1
MTRGGYDKQDVESTRCDSFQELQDEGSDEASTGSGDEAVVVPPAALPPEDGAVAPPKASPGLMQRRHRDRAVGKGVALAALDIQLIQRQSRRKSGRGHVQGWRPLRFKEDLRSHHLGSPAREAAAAEQVNAGHREQMDTTGDLGPAAAQQTPQQGLTATARVQELPRIAEAEEPVAGSLDSDQADSDSPPLPIPRSSLGMRRNISMAAMHGSSADLGDLLRKTPFSASAGSSLTTTTSAHGGGIVRRLDDGRGGGGGRKGRRVGYPLPGHHHHRQHAPGRVDVQPGEETDCDSASGNKTDCDSASLRAFGPGPSTPKTELPDDAEDRASMSGSSESEASGRPSSAAKDLAASIREVSLSSDPTGSTDGTGNNLGGEQQSDVARDGGSERSPASGVSEDGASAGADGSGAESNTGGAKPPPPDPKSKSETNRDGGSERSPASGVSEDGASAGADGSGAESNTGGAKPPPPDPKSKSETKPKSDTNGRPKPGTEAKPKSGTKAGSTKAKAKSKSRPKPQPDTKAKTTAKAKAGPKATVKAKANTKATPQRKAESKPKRKAAASLPGTEKPGVSKPPRRKTTTMPKSPASETESSEGSEAEKDASSYDRMLQSYFDDLQRHNERMKPRLDPHGKLTPEERRRRSRKGQEQEAPPKRYAVPEYIPWWDAKSQKGHPYLSSVGTAVLSYAICAGVMLHGVWMFFIAV